MLTSTFVHLPVHPMFPTVSGVAHQAGGRALRRTLETKRHAWLTCTAAAAYLPSVGDHAGPPA